MTETPPAALLETRARFVDLQERVRARLEAVEGEPCFVETLWRRDSGEGRTLTGTGKLLELAVCEVGLVRTVVPAWLATPVPVLDGVFADCVELSLHVWSQHPRVPALQLCLRRVAAGGRRWAGGGCVLLPGSATREDVRAWDEAVAAAFGEALAKARAGGEVKWRLAAGEQLGEGGFWLDDAGGPWVPEAHEGLVVDAVLNAFVGIALRRRGESLEEPERAAQLLGRVREVDHRVQHESHTFGATRRPLPPSIRWTQLPPTVPHPGPPNGLERRGQQGSEAE